MSPKVSHAGNLISSADRYHLDTSDGDMKRNMKRRVVSFYFIVVQGGGTLWHLQKSLQCIIPEGEHGR
jgi:hypothetical protein